MGWTIWPAGVSASTQAAMGYWEVHTCLRSCSLLALHLDFVSALDRYQVL